MADGTSQLPWTDEQWNRVRQVVYEEARGARVAGNLLPLYGPLDRDAMFVAKEVLRDPDSDEDSVGYVPGFTVEDSDTLKLATLQTKVYLRREQVVDPALASALIAFRRAANVVARLEDDIIFNGQAGENEGPKDAGQPRRGDFDKLWQVRSGQESRGLLDSPAASSARAGRNKAPVAPPAEDDLSAVGSALVSFVSRSIGDLEGAFHLGPFAVVLDQIYFTAVQTPNKDSLVLPQDRILPFLGGGSLVRSSTLRPRSGIIVALGGAPIDLVVGTDITVEFLQATTDALFAFRVYERIVLRIKDEDAIVSIPSDLW